MMARTGTKIVLLFCLLSTFSILLLISNLWQHWSLSLAALGYFSAFCLYILRYYPTAFILLMFFLFMRLTTLISGVAIESGGTMQEILTQGSATGAFVRLAGVYTIGTLFMAMVIEAAKPYIPKSRIPLQELLAPAVFGLTLTLCAIAAAVGLQHGFPLLTGMDRIAYWQSVDSRFLQLFLGNRFILALLLGLTFAIEKGLKQKVSLALIAIILAISFLFAEKFTSISLILFSFVTPAFLLKQSWQDSLLKRVVPLGTIISLLTIPAVLIVYGVLENPTRALEKFQARVTSQAQVWFYEDSRQTQLFDSDMQKIQHNLKAITVIDGRAVEDTAPYLGVKDIMDETMAPDVYKNYRSQGITLTMATEGYLLKLFGWLGMMPIYLLCLAVYTMHLLYVYYAIQSADPVRIILGGKLLFWSSFGLNQGYVWYLIGVKSLAVIAIIIMYELIARKVFRKEQRAMS
jgi:hypothetical protein